MQSQQEEAGRMLSEFSMGAPFVFEPAPWHKGGRPREPADLVWACNRWLILMWFAVNGKSASKAVNHNLIQARGRLKMWRTLKRDLRGANLFGDVEVSETDYPFVVVIFVVEAPDAGAAYHADYVEELGVTACVTFPMEGFRKLASMGASTVDVLNWIRFLRDEPAPIDQKTMLTLLDDYKRVAWDRAGAANVWPNGPDEMFTYASRMIQDSRQPWPRNEQLSALHTAADPSLESIRDQHKHMASIFNDMNLTDYLRVVSGVGRVTKAVKEREVGRKQLWAPSTASDIEMEAIALQHHDLVVVAYPMSQFVSRDGAIEQMVDDVYALANKTSRRGPDKPGPIVMLETERRVATIVRPHVDYASKTETLLAAWEKTALEISAD